MHRDKVERRAPGDGGGGGESVFNGDKVCSLGKQESSGDGRWGRLHESVNVFNAAELYA